MFWRCFAEDGLKQGNEHSARSARPGKKATDLGQTTARAAPCVVVTDFRMCELAQAAEKHLKGRLVRARYPLERGDGLRECGNPRGIFDRVCLFHSSPR